MQVGSVIGRPVTIELIRPCRCGGLSEFSAQQEKAFIGLSTVGGGSSIDKLTRLGNLASGFAPKSPCLCGLDSERASAVFPVRALWPLIRRGVSCGQKLFSTINRWGLTAFLIAIYTSCRFLMLGNSPRMRPDGVKPMSSEKLGRLGQSLLQSESGILQILLATLTLLRRWVPVRHLFLNARKEDSPRKMSLLRQVYWGTVSNP